MRTFATLLISAFSALPAVAASSQWLDVDGGSLRFLAREKPAGGYEAALQVKLDEGFKTYWTVPGSSGLPPVLNISIDRFGSGVPGGTVSVDWPAPAVYEDGSGYVTGYSKEVVVPVDISGTNGLRELTASGIIGVCGEICIPVQFTLTAPLEQSASSSLEEAQVFAMAGASVVMADDVGLNRKGDILTAPTPAGTAKVFWVSAQPGTVPVPGTIENGTAHFQTKGEQRPDGLLIIDGVVHPARIEAARD
jgi:hypothetical protein